MEGRDTRETFAEAVIEEMNDGLSDPTCLEAELVRKSDDYTVMFHFKVLCTVSALCYQWKHVLT